MKYLPTCLIAIILVFLALAGCSSQSNPVIANNNESDSPSEIIDENALANYAMLGSWNAAFDLDDLSVEITPNREISGHWNVTSMIPSPGFTIISYDPILGVMDIDAKVVNPYNLTGYDLRMIVYTDDESNRLMNPDGWISLYDIPGGAEANPFKAFASDVPNREFGPFAQITDRLKIYFPSGMPSVDFAINVSFPGNCPEPYMIGEFTQEETLYDEIDATTPVSVEVFDWQDDVNSVFVYCPVVTGVNMYFLSQSAPGIWDGDVPNGTGVSEGVYSGYVAARSDGAPNLPIYAPISLTVSALNKLGWVKTWGSIYTDSAVSIDFDSDENILVAGYFSETIDLDPGPEVLEFQSLTTHDVFLSKFTPEGNLVWGVPWDTYCYGQRTQVSVDSDDNSCVAAGEVGIRQHNIVGDETWTRTLTDLYSSHQLKHNSQDSIHFGGQFSGLADFDPGLGLHTFDSYNGTYDGYLNVLDHNGQHDWTITFRSLDGSSVTAFEFADFDSCMITGVFKGTTDFDSGPDNEWRDSFGDLIPFPDPYLAKYTSDGEFEYVHTWGGASMETPTDVAIGKSERIYVYGYFADVVDFDPDPLEEFYLAPSGDSFDLFISIFDKHGEFIEAIQIGGTGNEVSTGMDIDSDGSIYLTGYFSDETDLDPGLNTDIHTSLGHYDIFVIKLLSDNTYDWGNVFGSVDQDAGHDIAVDSEGNIYVAGEFYGEIDFNPGIGEEIHNTEGVMDCFLLKILPSGGWE